MNRKSLFILLCVGVVVRSSPAQDYLRSRYTSSGLRDADLDLPTPYDVGDMSRDGELPRYREDFELKTYTERTQQRDLVAPPRTVTFYRDEDRPETRAPENYEDRLPALDQRRYVDDRATLNRYEPQRSVANRDDIGRFPENRYLTNRNTTPSNRYLVRQTNYSPPQNAVPPSAYRNSRSSYYYPSASYQAPANRAPVNRAPVASYGPSWPPYPSRGSGLPQCSHGPVTPHGTYVGDGIAGQPVLYTNGQPVRNLFRSLGL